MDSEHRLLIYGATGAVGRRLAEIAALHEVTVVLAGRRRAELEALAAPLGAEVRVAALDRVDTVVDGITVLASCVGPYTHFGLPMLEAAISAGAHYLDLTGEPRYVATLLDRHDQPARRAGVTIVPSAGLGFCSRLAAKSAVAALRGPDTGITIGYLPWGMRPSRGTIQSTIEIVTGRPRHQQRPAAFRDTRRRPPHSARAWHAVPIDRSANDVHDVAAGQHRQFPADSGSTHTGMRAGRHRVGRPIGICDARHPRTRAPHGRTGSARRRVRDRGGRVRRACVGDCAGRRGRHVRTDQPGCFRGGPPVARRVWRTRGPHVCGRRGRPRRGGSATGRTPASAPGPSDASDRPHDNEPI
jgi:hypothetical protein